MTVAASFAARPIADTSGAVIGCIADSRLHWKGTEVEDGFDKLFPLSERACAVGTGEVEPFQEAHAIATKEIERQSIALARAHQSSLGLWQEARIFFGELREKGIAHSKKLSSAIAGFLSDGSPAVAEATLFPSGDCLLMLFKPKLGEIVVRTVGARAAASLLAEALAMDAALHPGRLDVAVSLLKDIADDPVRINSELLSVGGAPSIAVCRALGMFEYPAGEIDGRLFKAGKWISLDEIDHEDSSIVRMEYRPVFQDLDTRNQVQRLFTGGAPRATFMFYPAKDGKPEHFLGTPDLFSGPEPVWATNDEAPVPFGMPFAPGKAHLFSVRFESGLHPEEKERLASYAKERKQPAARREANPSRPKRRKPKRR